MKQHQNHTMPISEQQEDKFSDEQLLLLCSEAMTPMPDDNDTQTAWENFESNMRSKHTNTTQKPKRIITLTVAMLSMAATLLGIWFVATQKDLSATDNAICYYKAIDTPEKVVQVTKQGRCTLSMPPATTTMVTLDDGTKVTLSASSTLNYPVSMEGSDKRVVELKGEAYFEVTHNAHRPFIVKTGNMKTMVLGTTFVVNAYRHDKPSVALIEGKVRIDNGETMVDIKPGQSGTLSNQKIVIDKMNTAIVTNWMSDSFDMDNISLQEALEAVGSWYNKTVVAHSNKHTNKRIHFRFSRKARVEEVVDALNEMGTANIKLQQDKIVID